MKRNDLFATIIVGLVTVTAAYAADTPAASTPAASGKTSKAKRAAANHAKQKKASQDAEPRAIAPPADK